MSTVRALALTALLMTGCAIDRCPECGEPSIPTPAAPNSNLQLYRECVQQLPLAHCNQLAAQWAQQDQLDRLERQNALMLGNQQFQMLNQYLDQQRRY
jgi:hypothetical protein